MASFTAGTTFVDGVANDVTAAKLGALVTNATPTSGFIQDRTAETIIATNDTFLIGDASDSNNLKRMTVANFTQTLPTAKVTTGTIETGTFGTTTSTAATITTGTIETGTFGTTTSTAATITSGTVTNLASTTGTIATLNSTTGTITTGVIPTLTSTTLITTGTGTAAAPAIVPTGDTNTGIFFPAADTIAFAEGGAEAMRIISAGYVLVGKTSALSSVAGVLLDKAINEFTVDGSQVMGLNRLTSDGTLIAFSQGNTLEGTISVSGNTVSYNPFAGSHWSQLEDGSRPEILRGTVLESINQLCQWPDGGNERFAKCKISDTVASKKVYGVFLDWDNSWDQTNDLYVTAVGLFVCRINASVTVQIGDLLESNGDGTARVQADDVIRSSTIGKVTSSIKTHEHPDGSYCVPTVLYCG